MGALALATSATAEPSDRPGLEKPLDAFISAFNRWDADYPAGVFTDDCVVMDIFPPFVWSGEGAARRWWTTLAGADAAAHARGAALRQHLERGPIEQLTGTADAAQFSTPATVTYVRGGAEHVIHGRWVVTERRTPRGWLISSHAWDTLDQH